MTPLAPLRGIVAVAALAACAAFVARPVAVARPVPRFIPDDMVRQVNSEGSVQL